MKKEFFLNIIFLLLANILIKPFYLLWVEVEVNNIVGPAVYGTYAGILSLCFIFQIIADPGLLNFNTTQIASNKKLVFERLPLMLGLKSILAILFLLVVYLFAYISGYGATQWALLPWISGNILLISINLFLRSNISAIGKYRWDSLFSVLDKVLMISVLIFMIYFSSNREDFGILDFVKGQMLAYALTSTGLVIFVLMQNIRVVPKIDFSAFGPILKKSIPYAWLLFLMTIYTRIDSFMLERLIADSGYQAGVYASAFRLFDAGSSFTYLFAVLLLPIFSTMLTEKKSVIELLQASASFLFAGIIIITVFTGLWSAEIMQFFYPNDYTPEYAKVFVMLMIALIPMALAYITGSLLTADNRLKELNRMAGLGVLINIALNFLLIPQYKAEGTAFATMITQFLMTLIQIGFIMYFFKIKMNLSSILKHLCFLILTILFAFLAKEFSPFKSWVNFAVGIIISLLPALILGLIRFDFFQSILKNKLSPK